MQITSNTNTAAFSLNKTRPLLGTLRFSLMGESRHLIQNHQLLDWDAGGTRSD
jgi:hypothetical protein